MEFNPQFITKGIAYREGYKYQNAKDYFIQTDIKGYDIDIQFLKLNRNGLLLVRSGYAWDGPSGPTKDDKYNMEASLVHDALYQLMRLGLLPQSVRVYADLLLKWICTKKGMWKIRAWYYLEGVKRFARFAADTKNVKNVIHLA